KDDVRRFRERAPVRLRFKGVEKGARQPAARQELVKGLLVDQAASSRVDEVCARLHAGEELPVEQVAQVGLVRQVQRDDLRLAHEVYQRRVTHPVLPCKGGDEGWNVTQQASATE